MQMSAASAKYFKKSFRSVLSGIIGVMRDQDSQMHDLTFCLYTKGLTTRDIGDVMDSIYGKNYSKCTISQELFSANGSLVKRTIKQ